jgi:hypothetical protein
MKLFYSSLFLGIPFFSFSQNLASSPDTAGASFMRSHSVLEQWEYKTDKKAKGKIFNALHEYNADGYITKIILPNPAQAGTYAFNEWQYDAKGKLISYRQGKIDADSAKVSDFSETYNYTYEGLLSRYRKENYEGEMSQTTEKTDYEYSAKGEKTEITHTILRVRKDTIFNDEVKYAGNGTPVERTINSYYPKGISDFTKYNGSGLPVESMRYDKGKAIQHKIYSYTYDKAGQLTEAVITDGIGKTVEKKKYEKDKITYTQLNTKGKVLNTSSLPYAPPVKYIYPSAPEVMTTSTAKKENSKYTTKQKLDKKKNKIVENYSGAKLISTDTYNAKGLVIESIPAEGNMSLQYEYTFY